METADIERLCDDVANAVERVRIGFRSKLTASEWIDRFWCLQDQVARLVESASDFQQQTFDIIQRAHPRLIPNIVSVLHFTEQMRSQHASAISAAILRINRSLIKIEFLREQKSAMVASA